MIQFEHGVGKQIFLKILGSEYLKLLMFCGGIAKEFLVVQIEKVTGKEND